MEKPIFEIIPPPLNTIRKKDFHDVYKQNNEKLKKEEHIPFSFVKKESDLFCNLRILYWNIHSFLNIDNEFKFYDILIEILNQQPDIICFLEATLLKTHIYNYDIDFTLIESTYVILNFCNVSPSNSFSIYDQFSI